MAKARLHATVAMDLDACAVGGGHQLAEDDVVGLQVGVDPLCHDCSTLLLACIVEVPSLDALFEVDAVVGGRVHEVRVGDLA